LFQELLIIP